MSLLEVRDLVVEHRPGLFGSPKRVLDGIDLDVGEGEAVGLMGPSGCGKTTLARAVMRLMRPTSGSIVFMGREIARERRLGWMATEMQMVFQDPMAAMDPQMTLRDSLLEPTRLTGLDEGRLWSIARELNIDDELLDRYPWQLSGGQVQRASLARVLALGPRLLILDEATSMLDVLVQAQVMEAVSRHREDGMSMLMISHSTELLDAVCDRSHEMRDGVIVDR